MNRVLLGILLTSMLLIFPALSWGETSIFQQSLKQNELNKETSFGLNPGNSLEAKGE